MMKIGGIEYSITEMTNTLLELRVHDRGPADNLFHEGRGPGPYPPVSTRVLPVISCTINTHIYIAYMRCMFIKEMRP